MDFIPNHRKAHQGFTRPAECALDGALKGCSPRFGHIAASNAQLIELAAVSSRGDPAAGSGGECQI
jgi:hypothetical protein